MTLEQLRYFLASASHLSFARAAEEFFVHQSAVAKSVARLEEEFGLRLFERGNRRLELTGAGHLLQTQARELLAHGEAVREAMRSYGMGLTGSLRLTATNRHFMHLMDLYSAFSREHPGIDWTFPPCTEDQMDEPLEQVLEDRADFGLCLSGSKLPPELGCLRLAGERIGLILPREHPMAGRESLTLAQLDCLKLVDSARWKRFPLAGLKEAYRERTGKELQPVPTPHRLQPGKELLSYLRANGCATPVPHSIAAHGGEDYVLLPLSDYQPDYALWLLWRRDNRNPAVPLFLRAVRAGFPGGE